MPVINISVENKIAEADGTLYVCDNSDFVAKFAFDAEWEAYENKTARFVYNNSYVDVVFTGNECPVPIISGTYFFNIGVYAGNLHTTTPARVPCKKSIRCGNEPESSASKEVRNEFLRVLDKRTGDLADLTTEAKDTLVAAINEVARTGGAGSMDLRVSDGYIQYSTDGGSTWTNLIAVADLKGADGKPGAAGADGVTPHIGDNGNWYVGSTDTGKPSRGATGAPGKDGADGKPGATGADGITPHIGDNGNWYIGDDDTGKPSRGEQGPGAEVFYIDLAGKYPSYTCPVAMADIKAAYEAGKELKCRFAMGMYTAVLPLFLPMPSSNTWLFSGAGALSAMGFPAQTMTIAIVNGTVQASDTRLASMDDIPTALKNPNALTIKIGGTTVTYDGSTAQTVTIADGTEVSY